MPEPARILISPGSVFVTAYMIELFDQGSFSDGDSGSWVVAENSEDLLGHLVATDLLGGGYIIPAEDIFNDIVRNSPVVAVTLPNINDIRLKRNEVQSVFDSVETKEKGRDGDKGKQASDYTRFGSFESADTSGAGKETVVYGSGKSLDQVTETRIEYGKRGLDEVEVVITTGSRRYCNVVAAIAAGGGYETIRFTSVREQHVAEKRQYTFEFAGPNTARDGMRLFRRLLANVEREKSVDMPVHREDGWYYPGQHAASRLASEPGTTATSQDIPGSYLARARHTQARFQGSSQFTDVFKAEAAPRKYKTRLLSSGLSRLSEASDDALDVFRKFAEADDVSGEGIGGEWESE